MTALDAAGTHLNVGCGPFPAPAPWVNLDCHVGDNVHPDVVVNADRPVAVWGDGTVDRVYLGHVLEHIPWADVPAFLLEIRRVLVPGGQVAVVGPDVFRTIRFWHEGHPQVPESKLSEVLENVAPSPGLGAGEDWPNARHHWNCYEARVVSALDHAGFSGVEAVEVRPGVLPDWPLVSHMPDQCAVLAHK